MKNIAIVCNPSSHKTKAGAMAAVAGKLLSKHNINFNIFIDEWPDNINDFTQAWVIGGDGTINFFINKYPEINIPIALFAGGTGNDFHWAVYGNVSFEKQLQKMLDGTLLKVDGGVCNGKLFLNGIGLGFDGAIIQDLSGKKKFPGKTSYMIAVLKNILFFKEIFCEVKANGSSVSEDILMISVANAKRYGGGFMVAPAAIVNDGLLDVNIVSKISLLKRLRYLPLIEKGKHLRLQLPAITYWQKDKVIIKSKKPLGGQRDGEFISGDYFEIECLPNRFTFVV